MGRFALETSAGRLGPRDAALTLTPEWQGRLPAAAGVEVAERRGVDLQPLDVRRPEDLLRLRAYIWPDQTARLELLDRAVTVASAPVDRGSADEWLARRLETPQSGRFHLVFHTIASQYFLPEVAARVEAVLTRAGEAASDDAPLGHFAMEADGGRGAVLRLTTWPGGEARTLGRADFHGRWVVWEAPPPS